MQIETGIAGGLIKRLLTRSSWLVAMFIMLVCLVMFATGAWQPGGDPEELMESFGFSLMSPSRHAFGPGEMLSLFSLVLIPGFILHWKVMLKREEESGCLCYPGSNALPLAAVTVFSGFLVISIPVLASSSIYPGSWSLLIVIIDQFLLAIALAWIVNLITQVIDNMGIMFISVWIVAVFFHLARSLSDIFIIVPQARGMVESNISLAAWHMLLAIVAVTLNAPAITRIRRAGTR